MKRITATAVLAILITAWTANLQAQSQPLKMAFIPLNNGAAEPADVDLFNQSMNQLLSWLPRQSGFAWINQDSLQQWLDDPLQQDFADIYEPFSLKQLNEGLQLQGVLFCDLVTGGGPTRIVASVIEFPSGVVVGRDSLFIKPLQVPQVQETISPILNRIREADRLYGTPFTPQEQGMLILTGDLQDSSHFVQCQSFLHHLRVEESQKPLRLKIIENREILREDNTICDLADQLNEKTQTSYILGLLHRSGQTLAQVWLPEKKSLAGPLEEVRFPVYPALDEMRCVEIPADSIAAMMINAALMKMPDRPADIIPLSAWIDQPVLAFRTAARLHETALRARKAPRPDSTSQIRRLYDAVISDRASKLLYAWAHLELGALLNQLGQYQEASDYLLHAETFFGPLPVRDGLILSRLELAKAYMALNEWAPARQTYDRLYHLPPDSALQAFAMQRIASLYEKQNRPDEAVHAYHTAAKINQRIGRPYDAAMIYQRLGQLMREQNRLDLSYAYLDTFLTQSQAMASEPALARAHFQMGLTRLARKERPYALEHFLKACDYMELLGDINGIARADLNIGAIYWQIGDTLQARQRYLSALNQAARNGDSTMVLLSTVNLAEIYTANGKWEQAQQFLDRALFIAESRNDMHEQARISYAKGLAYLKEGRLRDGYSQIKGAMALGGGSVNGDAEKEQAFLRKLQSLIGDIETIRSTTPARR